MTRDELKEWMEDAGLCAIAVDRVLAEYDRQSALIAKLMGVCIRAQMRADADPNISADSSYYLELQAAIHAAESEEK